MRFVSKRTPSAASSSYTLWAGSANLAVARRPASCFAAAEARHRTARATAQAAREVAKGEVEAAVRTGERHQRSRNHAGPGQRRGERRIDPTRVSPGRARPDGRPLEHRHVGAVATQVVGGRETDHAPADDDMLGHGCTGVYATRAVRARERGCVLRDPVHAMRVGAGLKAGTVWINDHLNLSADVPITGFGQLGYGTEFGEQGLLAMTRTKHLAVSRGSP